MLADAAAAGRGQETVKIDDVDAEFTYKLTGGAYGGWFAGKPLFDVAEKELEKEEREEGAGVGSIWNAPVNVGLVGLAASASLLTFATVGVIKKLT